MTTLTLATAVDWFLQDAQARNLSPRTVIFYRERLHPFLDEFGTADPVEIKPASLKLWINQQREKRGWSIGTTNHTITSLKVLFKFLVDEEVLEANPTRKLSKMKDEAHLPEPFTDDEIKRLLAIAGTGLLGVRDQSMMLIMLDCGLRMQELLDLSVADVDVQAGKLHVRCGKGRKARMVPFSPPVRRVLMKYIAFRTGKKPLHDQLWVARDGEPLTREGFKSTVDRWGRNAKIAKCHPHKFRHTMAANYAKNGGSLTYLQQLLGHASQDMVQRYSHIAGLDATEDHRQASPAARLLGNRWRG